MKPSTARKPSKAIAKPYEPTQAEGAVLASSRKRRDARPPVPRMTTEVKDAPDSNGQTVRTINLSVKHDDEATGFNLLAAAIGNDSRTFLDGMLDGLALAATTTESTVSEQALNFGISIVAGLRPRDPVEAMLGAQMAAIQIATMKTAERLGRAKGQEALAANEKALNRLTRTFAAQVEALKRYRSKGEQRVYVERVNVEQGGQAIVGPVNHGSRGGGDDNENGR